MIITNYSHHTPLPAFKNRITLATFFFIISIALSPSISHAKDPLFSRVKKTVAIDPGHGGYDTGAKGADGTLEKNVALSFSKALSGDLGSSFNVMLTRTDDHFVDTDARVEAANRVGADVMISIHVNGNFSAGKQGLCIYYNEPRKSPPPGTMPPSTPVGQHPSSMDWDSVQLKYVPSSQLFARSLAKKISLNPAFSNTSAQGLPIAVFSGADMPSILIELGNLSHPSDEKNLRNSDFLLNLSQVVASALTDFLQTTINGS